MLMILRYIFSFRPHSSASQDLAVSAIESCVVDVRALLVSHRLMFNDTKTELLLIGSKHQLSKVSIDSIMVGDSQVKPSEAWAHGFTVAWAWTYKSGKYAIKLSMAYVTGKFGNFSHLNRPRCHLDYCNSLLYGISQCQINRLQKVFNSAARIITLIPKFHHITPVLLRLHWLPINFRIQFKVAFFVHKSLNGTAPAYLKSF